MEHPPPEGRLLLGMRYRIGEWQLTPRLNEIRRNGEAVRLEPKTAEVLAFLVEQPGAVVGREKLLSAIWPGVVVGDDALTQAIIKLRKALGDPAREPRYIETISKRGYRLVAPVERIEEEAADPPRPGIARAAPTAISGRARWRRFALAFAGASLLGVGLWLYAPQRPPIQPASQTTITAGIAADPVDALPTIAIVPFEALGSGADASYLSRGIAADLLTDVSQLSGLRVITVSRLNGQVTPLARYLVSGSVQRGPERLDINVRLSDAKSGQQLWAERYSRRTRDLFVVQEEITRRLLDELPVRVSEAERRRLSRRYTRNLEAYDFFLRGKAAFLARTRNENDTARAMYLKALQLDPAFARAYAGLALTYTAEYRNQWTGEGMKALDRASELAQTASRIDPEIPEVYGVLAYVSAVARRHDQAIEHLSKAIALDRSYADAYAFMGAVYTHIGQPSRAIPLLRTAMRLNPEAGFIYFMVLGRAYLFQGDTEQAFLNLREALDRNPADLETHVYMAATLVAAGNPQEAKWEAAEIGALQSGFSTEGWLQTSPMTDAGQKQRLVGWMASIGL